MARVRLTGSSSVFFSPLDTLTANTATYTLRYALFVSITQVYYIGSSNKVSNITPVKSYSNKVGFVMQVDPTVSCTSYTYPSET